MSSAARAIMAKVALLYGEEDEGDDGGADPGAPSGTFLAFNALSMPLSTRDLAFAEGGEGVPSTTGDLRAAVDFATLVNRVPEVRSMWSPKGSLVWDVYEQVLNRAELANDELSPAEERELERARDLLFEEGGEDDSSATRTPSAVLESYREHEAAYHEAEQELSHARLTLEHSDDPERRATLEQEVAELERVVERARQRWITEGRKNDVERAFEDIDRLTGRGPERTWADRRQRLERAMLSDPSLDRDFYQTSYWPTGFYRDEAARAWTRVTMDRSEVDSLIERARSEDLIPGAADLEAGGGTSSDLDVVSVSVELARVDVVRPWFDPALLQSGAWRWPRDRPPLSDGRDPPDGLLPAYVTSLIFARNVEVELEPDSEANEEAVAELQKGKLVTFGPLPLKPVAASLPAARVSHLGGLQLDAARSSMLHHMASTGLEASGGGGGPSLPPGVRGIGGPGGARESEEEDPDGGGGSDEGGGSDGGGGSSSSGGSVPPGLGGVGGLRVSPEALGGGAASGAGASGGGGGGGSDAEEGTGESSGGGGGGAGSPRFVREMVAHIDPAVLETTPTEDPEADEPAGGYRGVVKERTDDGIGDALEDVSITFEKEDGSVVRTATSDDGGRYEVALPEGRYVVTAELAGYEPYSTSPGYFVREGDDYQTGNIFLEPAEEPEGRVEKEESLQLLAFVCRRVPRAPDPDDSLDWA